MIFKRLDAVFKWTNTIVLSLSHTRFALIQPAGILPGQFDQNRSCNIGHLPVFL
jgi:hypothetical protein